MYLYDKYPDSYRRKKRAKKGIRSKNKIIKKSRLNAKQLRRFSHTNQTNFNAGGRTRGKIEERGRERERKKKDYSHLDVKLRYKFLKRHTLVFRLRLATPPLTLIAARYSERERASSMRLNFNALNHSLTLAAVNRPRPLYLLTAPRKKYITGLSSSPLACFPRFQIQFNCFNNVLLTNL